ncbi:FAD-dependent oxidoreductase [Streptomyces sp. NPDC054796]
MGDVIVLGGGVIGLTTAVLLAERGMPVRVWGRDPGPETTSSVAGGLCWPYRIEPERQALDWSVRAFRNFAWLAEQPGLTGVRLVPGFMRDGEVPPEWAALVGPRTLAPLIDMRAYLPYLRGRLERAGGRYERRTVTTLDEAAGATASGAGGGAGVVVNCTGLGARELVPDPLMRPVRGQIVVVENPGVEEWYADPVSDPVHTTYILPQPFGAVLGGTAQDGSGDTVPDPATAEAIIRRCARVHPALAHARVLEHRVGLRPYRPRVRLEAERLPGGTLCVHNYGHGGAGVTVSWGCAVDAARLVADVES